MMPSHCTVTRILLPAVIPVVCLAQSEKRIELRYADVTIGKVINGEPAREFNGKVHFVQNTESGRLVHVWCDNALQYLNQNKVDMTGHVKVVRDSTTMTSDAAVYYGDVKKTETHSGVKLTRPNSVLTARNGEYFADERRSHFWGDVMLMDTSSSIACDDMVYWEDDAHSIAVGHVRVVDAAASNTVFGDSMVHHERTRYTLVPKNPRLVKFDTSATGSIDTFVVVSKTMESFQDSTERFVATDSVLMARSDLSADCGLATFSPRRDLIILQHQPVVWQGENQISGDSIVVTLEHRIVKTVVVRGRAMAISRADSVRRKRFNQLTGRAMTMFFERSRLHRVEVDRNATSLYYLYDGTAPNGSNRSSGDRIFIDFENGRIETIKVAGGVLGQYYPEKMIVGRESEYNLDGFRWLTLRPRQQATLIARERYD